MTYFPGGGGGALPDLIDGVEISSGREIDGQPTFLKLITVAGALGTGARSDAHGITGLDVIYKKTGTMQRDNGDQIPTPFASSGLTFVNSLRVDSTNILTGIGTGWVGAGNLLSDARYILEYSKV